MRAEYEIDLENETEKLVIHSSLIIGLQIWQRELDRNIDAFRDRIKDQKQALGGVNAGAENQIGLGKQVQYNVRTSLNVW